jgi:hypothetical protein
MPLDKPELFGTEADGSRSEKYCAYCYQNGAFTQPDATLEEMIEISARGWSDHDPNVPYEQAKAQLAQFLPHMERWRK